MSLDTPYLQILKVPVGGGLFSSVKKRKTKELILRLPQSNFAALQSEPLPHTDSSYGIFIPILSHFYRMPVPDWHISAL